MAVGASPLPRPRAAAPARRGPAAAPPPARSVLAVVARPGDESSYLGAILDAYRRAGGLVGVLAFTRGEASPHNDTAEPLESLRLREFEHATGALRLGHRTLADYPDGRLHRFPVERLAEHVERAVRRWEVDLIVTIDGRLAERSAAHAAVWAGRQCGVPVLGWTLPHAVARAVSRATGLAVTGDAHGRIEFELRVTREAREAQRRAMNEHRSQSPDEVVQLARLAVQGDREWLRWLFASGPRPGAAAGPPPAC